MSSYGEIISRLRERTTCDRYENVSRVLVALEDKRARGSAEAEIFQQRLARAGEIAARCCKGNSCGFENNAQINIIGTAIAASMPDIPMIIGVGNIMKVEV